MVGTLAAGGGALAAVAPHGLPAAAGAAVAGASPNWAARFGTTAARALVAIPRASRSRCLIIKSCSCCVIFRGTAGAGAAGATAWPAGPAAWAPGSIGESFTMLAKFGAAQEAALASRSRCFIIKSCSCCVIFAGAAELAGVDDGLAVQGLAAGGGGACLYAQTFPCGAAAGGACGGGD